MKLIYFIKPRELDGPIQIGCATALQLGKMQLDTVAPMPLEIIATTRGSEALLRGLHKEFAHFRAHGEWFNTSPELLALIAVASAGQDIKGFLPKVPPPTLRVPDPRTPEMRAMIADDKTYDAIGKHFGISRERVRQIAKRNDLGGGLKSIREKHALFLKEFCVDQNFERARNAAGIAIRPAQMVLRKNGLALHDLHLARTAARLQPLIDRVVQGESIRSVAAENRVTESLIARTMARHGLYSKKGRWHKLRAIAASSDQAHQ